MPPKPITRVLLLLAFATVAFVGAAEAQTRCTNALPCIHVERALYGPPGGSNRTCSPTSTLRGACDRRLTCDIKVDNNLCGDPAPGVTKQLFVEWTCTGQDNVRFDAVREGGVMKLGCGL